jgi:sulfate adenylyltransferase
MLPKPHGGTLVDRVLRGEAAAHAMDAAARAAHLEVALDVAKDAVNIATGVMSPLDGFMKRADFEACLAHGRLGSGVPWTIPVVLDVSGDEGVRLDGRVALTHQGEPFALLEVREVYRYDREAVARAVFGTADRGHPGVERVYRLKEWLVAGPVDVFRALEGPLSKYSLTPRETRVLFAAKGWRTVVGFQTRNVPHVGHEYVQKNALSFVDGLFVNPVIGRKKPGDFRDEVILRAYQVLMEHYYPRERTVLAILETEMRYAGPREAIFHAILRKNFGCTHFIVGRDHAGVGRYYAPYAAQEIFDDFPDLGIVPLFFSAFFHCPRCGGVANEKTCPHDPAVRHTFSGTLLRDALSRADVPAGLVRPEVLAALRGFGDPFT